jgi:hypothetical protein
MKDFTDMAEDILFAGEINLLKHKVVYRKNKTIYDVKNARAKALKNGRQKVEQEIGWFAVYLGQIFKQEPQ